MTPTQPIEVRSYRTVFDLERRIYRIDRLRLNPGGIPVRGVVYLLALLLAAAVLAALPPSSWVMRTLPWYLRELALPTAAAAVLTLIRIEGRPFHLAARSLVRLLVGPRQLAGLRACPGVGGVWLPPDVIVLPDGSDARVRRLSFRGPGAVLVACPHELTEWRRGGLPRLLRRPDLTLREVRGRRTPTRAQVIELRAGARLELRPATATGRRA